MASNFYWYISGFSSEKTAEDQVFNMLEWFNKTYNSDEWTLTTSVGKNPFGWTAEVKAAKEAA